MGLTTDPKEARESGIDPATGQQRLYVVLSEEERAKGFVRPVMRSYRHVGVRPKRPTRPLTAEEHERYDRFGYVQFEAYEPSEGGVIGRYWTKEQLEGGCGAETQMGLALCETYARNPKYYTGTFCCQCRKHFPVEEFVWVEDGSPVGSTAEKAAEYLAEKERREVEKHKWSGI